MLMYECPSFLFTAILNTVAGGVSGRLPSVRLPSGCLIADGPGDAPLANVIIPGAGRVIVSERRRLQRAFAADIFIHAVVSADPSSKLPPPIAFNNRAGPYRWTSPSVLQVQCLHAAVVFNHLAAAVLVERCPPIKSAVAIRSCRSAVVVGKPSQTLGLVPIC